MFHWSNIVKKLCKVERGWRYWRGLLIEVCVCVCVETERDRERERGGGERQTSLCGTTVLVLLMQYSRLVLCKSFLCECKCSKISNFWLDKSLNLIIPAAAFFITSFLAQLNQFMVFFRYIIFLFFFLLLLLQLIWIFRMTFTIKYVCRHCQKAL